MNLNLSDGTEYRQVTSPDELNLLSELASKIWNEYYPPIIGHEQVDYMLGKMYSPEGLRQQLEQGHMFTAAFESGVMVGFLSKSKLSEGSYMIHKWYVDVKKHGKGIGRSLFDAAFDGIDFNEIRLTVNRQNVQAINFYFRFGFVIEKSADFDIGDGFFMNDFVMVFRKK